MLLQKPSRIASRIYEGLEGVYHLCVDSRITGDKMERDRAERRAAAEKEAKKDAKQDAKPIKPVTPSASARETRHGATKAAPAKDKKGKAPAKSKAQGKEPDDGTMEKALATAPAKGKKRKAAGVKKSRKKKNAAAASATGGPLPQAPGIPMDVDAAAPGSSTCGT